MPSNWEPPGSPNSVKVAGTPWSPWSWSWAAAGVAAVTSSDGRRRTVAAVRRRGWRMRSPCELGVAGPRRPYSDADRPDPPRPRARLRRHHAGLPDGHSPPTAGFRHTETWVVLSLVKGDRVQSAQRPLGSRPARCAMRGPAPRARTPGAARAEPVVVRPHALHGDVPFPRTGQEFSAAAGTA